MRNRTDLLNKLIRTLGYKRYLEIGVDNPDNNFNKIECESKLGVDPNPASSTKATSGFVLTTTSDKFFEHADAAGYDAAGYDLIFIDGDHAYAQCKRDLENSLKHLSPKGTIVMHDVNPQSEQEQLGDKPQGIWCGQAWKVFVEARMNPALCGMTFPFDHGCGVLFKRGMTFLPIPLCIEGELTYARLDANRAEWLGFVEGVDDDA